MARDWPNPTKAVVHLPVGEKSEEVRELFTIFLGAGAVPEDVAHIVGPLTIRSCILMQAKTDNICTVVSSTRTLSIGSGICAWTRMARFIFGTRKCVFEPTNSVAGLVPAGSGHRLKTLSTQELLT